MKLYFFRHAHAEPHGTRDDHDRKLTAEGVHAATTAAKVMKALNILPLTIYTSPRERALHTANIAAAILNASVLVSEEVNFGFDANAVERLLASRKQHGDVMFVGHEPYMSETIRQITSGIIELKKAGFARVDVEPSVSPLRGTLVWLVSPKIVEVLSK